MEQQANQIEALFTKATEYANNKLELAKLKGIKRTSAVLSSTASFFIMFCIAALFLFALNVAVAFLLGEMLGKIYYGFFVLAGFYFLLGLIYLLFRKTWVKTPVSDAVIKNLTK